MNTVPVNQSAGPLAVSSELRVISIASSPLAFELSHSIPRVPADDTSPQALIKKFRLGADDLAAWEHSGRSESEFP
jgi:hypothetical protein